MTILFRRTAVLALLLAAVTACSSSGSSGPLALGSVQEGMSSCAPNSSDGAQAWGAPIGSTEETYWDQASVPLTIKSVSLLDSHNLVLHGSVLYRMRHASHALAVGALWAQQGTYAFPPDWRARQRVPGAVMPPAGGPPEVNGKLNTKIDRWQVDLDVSAASPAGGWALGEIVRYQAAGVSYTLKAENGIAIAAAGPANRCDPQMNAIQAAYAAGH